MTRLEELEDRSVYIIREAYKNLDNLCMLWSMGKDSTVLLWLVRKAFFGHCPIPLVHIDTSYKIPEMISYRDTMAKEWGLDLVVARNGQALEEGMHPSRGTFLCCSALKTEALKQLLAQKGYTGVIVGVRSDEEGTRAKERYFSPRDSNNDWDFREQPPELWDQFKTRFEPGTHLRVHPLLDWSELDIWEYIEAEGIPVIPLYLRARRRKALPKPRLRTLHRQHRVVGKNRGGHRRGIALHQAGGEKRQGPGRRQRDGKTPQGRVHVA